MPYVISYDLGTGGLKAGLYRQDGSAAGFEFIAYETFFPGPDRHEQRPEDWWKAVCQATRNLLLETRIDAHEVAAVAASGHSLVTAPIDDRGRLLLQSVPIWSDRRAKNEAGGFFKKVDYQNWYMTTGNGDPPETYSVFKLMWLKEHEPAVFAQTKAVLGTKDFINFKLTGNIATDYSYASGSGVFALESWRYSEDFISASGIPRSLFIEPRESHAVVGEVTTLAAAECGLCEGTRVYCGGVDNACMALGTTGLGNGRVYTSLGSSAWIAVSSRKPVLDVKKLPFVFAHVERGYYTSGVSIFAAGNAYRWARDTFCVDLVNEPFERMNELAAASPTGANNLMFYPALSGGSSQEPDENLQGAFLGLTLAHTRADLLRSILEGVALSLGCFCLPVIESFIDAQENMILCGGGSKSSLWMQIFADIYRRRVVIANVDQNAASLGAAAIAARGAGFWPDYSPLDRLFEIKKSYDPITEHVNAYKRIEKKYSLWVYSMAASFNKAME